MSNYGISVWGRHYPQSRSTGEMTLGSYREVYDRSLADPEGFWEEAAGAITWDREPTVVLDTSNPPFYRWFPDGVLNTCFNAVDRHVSGGRADQTALIYDSPVTGTVRLYTYRELLDEVSRLAGALAELEVEKAIGSSSTCR